MVILGSLGGCTQMRRQLVEEELPRELRIESRSVEGRRARPPPSSSRRGGRRRGNDKGMRSFPLSLLLSPCPLLPNDRRQIWFGLLISSICAIVYIRIEPYRGRICGHVQATAQLCILFRAHCPHLSKAFCHCWWLQCPGK